jgi:hypothetical protein
LNENVITMDNHNPLSVKLGFFLGVFFFLSQVASGYQLMNVLTHSAWLPSSKVFFYDPSEGHGQNFFFFLGPTKAHGAKIIARWLASKATIVEQPPRYSILGGGEADSQVICIMKVVVQEYGTRHLFFCCVVVSSVHDIVHRLTWNHVVCYKGNQYVIICSILVFSFRVWSLMIETNIHKINK